MSESEAKFLIVIKGAGRREHMDDQYLSYKRHIRYFLQRKKDLRCWQNQQVNDGKLQLNTGQLSSVQLPQEPTLWLLHYESPASCRSGMTRNQPAFSIDT